MNNEYTILYNFATRSRPEKFKEAVESITKNATHSKYKILVKFDKDDPTMPINVKGVTYAPGYSRSKIHAINRDIPGQGWDILINMSDDMRFIKQGFDTQIINDFNGNLDQLLHYPDGRVNQRLITLSIMGKDYYDRFGYVYHPDYISLWCDNEAQDVAIELGKYKYIDNQLFVHNHPAFTGEEPDALLRSTEKYYRHDGQTYNKRKAAGFPINSIF